MGNSEAICASCRENKFKVTARPSRLKPDQIILLCDSCIKAKYEPRWIVMMIGREKGIDAVREWVRPKRYLGDPILLEDLC